MTICCSVAAVSGVALFSCLHPLSVRPGYEKSEMFESWIDLLPEFWSKDEKKKIFYLLVFTFFCFCSSTGYKIFYNLSANTTSDEYFASKLVYVWMLKTTAGRISIWVWCMQTLSEHSLT